ncbi:MAG: asparagine synthase (glutamine-hydrolyzing) [Deltaproteobacteria bacterium]|nr:asparagine synthase (glutamine-hydrolyzing) [Deltaproteobacteria bacterium]
MCGIAGIVSRRPVDGVKLKAMSRSMPHRGPDGWGYLLHHPENGSRTWLNSDYSAHDSEGAVLGLAHRRLSILDLSPDGLQPMPDPSKKIFAVYNGEIYNYLELKGELSALGHEFKTTSDTEVLLAAYKSWGPSCASRFVGMWSFVIWDTEKNRLIICRDRFGIKPLYYAFSDGAFYFASEIKALAEAGLCREPDSAVVARFLWDGGVDTDHRTFFAGIFQFPAAHYAVLDLNGPVSSLSPVRYWDFPSEPFAGSPEQAIEMYREIFLDSVSIHARSDVPVGTCLSGGLDSSSIVCAAEKLRAEGRIPAYTHSAFGYTPEDPRYSERPFMQEVVDATAAKMHYVMLSREDFIESIPKICATQDEPFGSTSIAVQWAVFREAKRNGITVMLDGQGADEMLGGYHSYFNTLAFMMLGKKDLLGYMALERAYRAEHGAKILPLSKAAVFFAPGPIRRLAGMAKRRLFPAGAMTGVVSQPFMLANLEDIPLGPPPESLTDFLKFHVTRTSLPGLLRYEDHNSMSHSIESRVPFLDHRLVDFLFSLGDDWKIRGAVTKFIMRESMKGILPEAVRTRKDKIGFMPAPGLTYDLLDREGRGLVENRTPWEKDWFDPQRLNEAVAARDSSPGVEYPLWRVVNLKMWLRQFFAKGEAV